MLRLLLRRCHLALLPTVVDEVGTLVLFGVLQHQMLRLIERCCLMAGCPTNAVQPLPFLSFVCCSLGLHWNLGDVPGVLHPAGQRQHCDP